MASTRGGGGGGHIRPSFFLETLVPLFNCAYCIFSPPEPFLNVQTVYVNAIGLIFCDKIILVPDEIPIHCTLY